MTVYELGKGLKKVLMSWTLNLMTTDTIKSILEKLVDYLRSQVDQTDVPFDDWVVDFLESVISDDGKTKVLTDFVKSKLSNVYSSTTPDYEEEEYRELAAILKMSSDGRCEDSPQSVSHLEIELLKTIVLILVGWMRNQETKG